MNIPYRTRSFLKRLGIVILTLVLVTSLILVFWFIWLQRFVVYTRDQGAIFDMNVPQKVPEGQAAVPPEPGTPVSIYYNEGENAINTSRELTQIVGYYADVAALEKSVDTVLEQVKALPRGTPVMLDVKSPKGAFFYNSRINGRRNSDIEPEKMDALIEYLDGNGSYLIARLPALRDYDYGLEHVSDGLPTAKGYLWADEDYCYWLNPGSQGTMTYLLQIVSELKDRGFDEVVFDEFRFPDTDSIVFNGDKTQALKDAAKTLVSAGATETFAVSFVGQEAAFALPEGRSRLYLEGIAATDAATVAGSTGIANVAAQLVFLTENHDTRFNDYCVLRPLEAAH